MKQLAAIAFLLTVFFSIQGCDDDRRAKNYNVSVDQAASITFVKKGLEGGNAELSLSKLALRNSHNSNVIKYAKKMVDDHLAANKDLKIIAKQQGVKPIDSLSTVHNQAMAALSKETGDNFDKDYIQAMVQDHEQTIELLKTGAANSDAKISGFANKMLPTIEEHLKAANEICAKLK